MFYSLHFIVATIVLVKSSHIRQRDDDISPDIAFAEEHRKLKSMEDLFLPVLEDEILNLKKDDEDLTYCMHSFYLHKDCAGSAFFVRGIRMNTCFNLEDGDKKHGNSMIYRGELIDNSLWAITNYHYTSDDCNGEPLAVTRVVVPKDCQDCSKDKKHDKQEFSSQVSCTNSSKPFDSYLHTGYCEANYELSDSQCSSEPMSFSWHATGGVCGAGYKYKCSQGGVNKLVFSNDECGSFAGSMMLPLSDCVPKQGETYGDHSESVFARRVTTCNDELWTTDLSDYLCGLDTVTMPGGPQKYISQLVAGDKVLVLNGHGQYVYSEVTSVTHPLSTNEQQSLSFVSLTTETGRHISAGSDKLLLAGECDNMRFGELSSAKSITAGHCVTTVDGLERVVLVEEWTTDKSGVIVQLTNQDERLIVNGVATASDTSASTLHRVLRRKKAAMDSQFSVKKGRFAEAWNSLFKVMAVSDHR